MQKAIIIKTEPTNYGELDLTELNDHLSGGWRFVSATPFGVSSAEGGQSKMGALFAAILVVVEKS